MSEHFEIHIVHKWHYVNNLPFLSLSQAVHAVFRNLLIFLFPTFQTSFLILYSNSMYTLKAYY